MRLPHEPFVLVRRSMSGVVSSSTAISLRLQVLANGYRPMPIFGPNMPVTPIGRDRPQHRAA
jgi:hypothetical protein